MVIIIVIILGLNTATVLNSSCIVHDATFWEEKEENFSFSTSQPSYIIINAVTQCTSSFFGLEITYQETKCKLGPD